ncbi:MAG: phage protease [Nitrospirota bacterium]
MESSEKLSFTLERGLDLSGNEVPDEVQILPSGQVSPKGKMQFMVDEDGMHLILAAFQNSNTDLVIDYEHQSLSGSEAPAAGWIKGLVDKGAEGLWAKVQWTDRAKEYLQKREYRYLSPVVLVRKKDGRAVELLGAALTNLPAIDGMAPVVNSAQKDYRNLYMEVLKFLDLPEDAETDAVRRKAEALIRPSGFVPEAEHLALKETLNKYKTEELVRQALSRGRITPALLPWARSYASVDPEGFLEFCGKATSGTPLEGGVLADELPSPSQTRVNSLLGLDNKTFFRYANSN